MRNQHVVLFPCMGQGHFIPFFRLANLLAAQRLTVSFLTTPANTSNLRCRFKEELAPPNIRLVSLSLPPIDGLPPGCESADVLSPTLTQLLFCRSDKLSGPFEQWLEHLIAVDASQKPLCIISDVLLPWATNSASRFGIPNVVFHTTGAFGASLLQYLFTNPVDEIITDREVIKIRDGALDVDLRRAELPLMLRSECWFSPYPVLGVLQEAFSVAKQSSAATLVNSFEAIEGGYVRYLQESTGKPVWSVASDPHVDNKALHDTSGCICWLDNHKPRSVVYIAFGSQAFLSEAQIKALAKGIQDSQQHFIWTIKDFAGSNTNSYDFLPEGFIEATRDRGIVIHGWVPQKLILTHSSIACFVSHCGWNSTLESIYAGVPILAWPMVFDQFFNAKLVLEHLKIGLKVCEGMDEIPNSSVVEATVKAAMGGEIGEQMRRRAKEIKDSAKAAAAAASSELNMERFLAYICEENRVIDV